MTRKITIALIVCCLFAGVLLAAPVEYYVCTTGSDNNSGMIGKPFATIQRARDALRSLDSSKKSEGAIVYIKSGRYVLKETLVFDLQDSALQGAQIRYQAYQNEKPVITSLKPVVNWQRLKTAPQGLPQDLIERVWVADVGKGSDFKVLYGNGEMLPRARSKGFTPVRSERGKASIKRLTVPDEFELRKWDNYKDVELLIRPTFAWSMNILPVADIDVAARQVNTTVGGTYPLEPQPQWSIDAHGIEDTCWFENALEFMSVSGNWVLDSDAGKLYLLTDGGGQPQGVEAPQCIELVRIEGKVREDMPADKPVRGIVFSGITFTGNDRYTWKDAEPSYQHDWSAVDQPNAMVRLRAAVDCVVEDCTFEQGATAGVRLDLHSIGNRIEGNRFTELGEHGIAICGYGPGTKDVNNRNKVLNNRIDHIGRLYWYAFGIYIAQSGENLIANNLIHNVPFVGITLSGCRDFNHARPRHGEGYRSIRWQDFGDYKIQLLQEGYNKHIERTDLFLSYLHARNNIVEGNEIFAAVEKMGDGNAIYLSGAGTGNIVRRNFIHNILSSGIQTALRPDDLQEQTLFSHNIVYKSVYGAVEHKHNNDYINNIFACIYPTNIHGRTWHEWGYVIYGRGPNTGSRLQNNIFYDESDNPRFYYCRANSPMDDSIVDNNIYYSSKNPQAAIEQLGELQVAGHDKYSLAVDPLFTDVGGKDFTLKSNSPAFDLGFEPINMSLIGLQSPYKEKLVGENLIRTTIKPKTHYIESGNTFTVVIKNDNSAAIIRYTTDGTEPTEKSPVYKSDLKFDEPVYVRAKSFKDGAIDLYGAAEFYAERGNH